MSNENENWLTTADAAKILKVTQRQVTRYAEEGRLKTSRAGRRLLYDAQSVYQLADMMKVNVRPPPASRESGAVLPPEVVRYLAEQRDQQQRIEDQLGKLSDVEQRLDRIEQHVRQPPQLVLPRWLLVIVVLLLMVLIAVFVVVLIRL